MCAGTEDHSVNRAIKCRVGVGMQDVETSRGRLRKLDFLCSQRGGGCSGRTLNLARVY